MRLVIVESPYSGDVERNVRYGRAALANCLTRGESPIASHLLLTQPGVLDDTDPDERALGVAAGHAWYSAADACVVYNDLGVSDGMWAGIDAARAAGVPIEWRKLGWRGERWTGRVEQPNDDQSYILGVLDRHFDTGAVQPRLLDEGVICDRCGRTWDPAKRERPGCAPCLTAIQAARGGR